jgi:uncharacterized protein
MIRSLHRLFVWLVLLPVMFYRRVLSPLKRAPSCIYLPTCSEYAIDAIKQRGIVVGIVLAGWRILRCNPLFHGGYDPVAHPPTTSARSSHAMATPLVAAPLGLDRLGPQHVTSGCVHQRQEQH